MTEGPQRDCRMRTHSEGGHAMVDQSGSMPDVDEQVWDVEMFVRPQHLATVRNVMATLAVHLDFDLDTVADLRLAADEVGNQLAAVADQGSRVDCRFRLHQGDLTMHARVNSTHPDGARTEGLGARILASLVDSVQYRSTPDPDRLGHYLIETSISKRQVAR